MLVNLLIRLNTYCAESGKTFIVEESLYWIDANHYNIDSKVELETI